MCIVLFSPYRSLVCAYIYMHKAKNNKIGGTDEIFANEVHLYNSIDSRVTFLSLAQSGQSSIVGAKISGCIG